MAKNSSLRRKRSKSASPRNHSKSHKVHRRSRSVGRGKRGGMLSGLMNQLAVPATLLYAQKRVQHRVKSRTKKHRRFRKK